MTKYSRRNGNRLWRLPFLSRTESIPTMEGLCKKDACRDGKTGSAQAWHNEMKSGALGNGTEMAFSKITSRRGE